MFSKSNLRVFNNFYKFLRTDKSFLLFIILTSKIIEKKNMIAVLKKLEKLLNYKVNKVMWLMLSSNKTSF